MKKRFIQFCAVLAFLIIAGVLSAGAHLNFFHASSDNDNVKLSWQTADEVNLKHFAVERKTPNSDFTEVALITAKGNFSDYEYIDKSAYKVNDVVYIYRLKIIDIDSFTAFSQEVTVAHSLSSVKRTWGSIKSLFR